MSAPAGSPNDARRRFAVNLLRLGLLLLVGGLALSLAMAGIGPRLTASLGGALAVLGGGMLLTGRRTSR